jgi:hypothetical protein
LPCSARHSPALASDPHSRRWNPLPEPPQAAAVRDRAVRRHQVAGQHRQQGGLAGAVRAGHQQPAGDWQIQVVHHEPARHPYPPQPDHHPIGRSVAGPGPPEPQRRRWLADLPAVQLVEPAPVADPAGDLRLHPFPVLLAVSARLTRGQRRRWLRLPRHWPWSKALTTAIDKIRHLPLPTPQPG